MPFVHCLDAPLQQSILNSQWYNFRPLRRRSLRHILVQVQPFELRIAGRLAHHILRRRREIDSAEAVQGRHPLQLRHHRRQPAALAAMSTRIALAHVQREHWLMLVEAQSRARLIQPHPQRGARARQPVQRL